MRQARAQIRRPLDSRAQVTISSSTPMARCSAWCARPTRWSSASTRSPQKARTTVFFSSPFAARRPARQSDARRRRLCRGDAHLPRQSHRADRRHRLLAARHRQHLAALFPGRRARPPARPAVAPDRAVQPLLDRAAVALITDDVLTHVDFVLGNNADVPQICTRSPIVAATGRNRLNNGITDLPGRRADLSRQHSWSARSASRATAIDQDDMIASSARTMPASASAARSATPTRRSAPTRSRSRPATPTTRLRYVLCPFNPFVGTNEQNVCQGK